MLSVVVVVVVVVAILVGFICIATFTYFLKANIIDFVKSMIGCCFDVALGA